MINEVLFLATIFNLTSQLDRTFEDGEDKSHESEDEQCDSNEAILYQFKKKKKKRGKTGMWENFNRLLDDLVDIVASKEEYKQRLIYKNTKIVPNTLLYQQILDVLKGKSAELDCEIPCTATQIRTKFRSLVSMQTGLSHYPHNN